MQAKVVGRKVRDTNVESQRIVDLFILDQFNLKRFGMDING